MKKTYAWMAAFSLLTIPVLAADKPADTAAKAANNQNNPEWVRVDQETWGVLEKEPQVHFDSARMAYNNKDYKMAASDLRAAENILKIQEDVLKKSEKDLAELASLTEKNDVGSYKQLDKMLTQLSERISAHRWLAVAAGQTDLVMGEPEYHLAKARDEYMLKDYQASVIDLRKAAVYMKLDAQHAQAPQVASTLKGEAQEIQSLADDTAANKIPSVSKFDQEINKAEQTLQTNG